MKSLQITKNGEIQGWFVSLCITINIMVLINLCFVFPSLLGIFEKIGGTISTIYIGQFASWLAYRGATTILGKSNEGGD